LISSVTVYKSIISVASIATPAFLRVAGGLARRVDPNLAAKQKYSQMMPPLGDAHLDGRVNDHYIRIGIYESGERQTVRGPYFSGVR
jgi:hypothetical protein